MTQTTNYSGQSYRRRGCRRGFPQDDSGQACGRGRGRGGRFNFPRLPTTYYTPDQWAKLTPAQRSNVLNARGPKHNISAVETEYYDEANYDDKFKPEYFTEDHTFLNLDLGASLLHHHNTDETQTVEAVTTTTESESMLHPQMNAGDQFGQR
jgi:hypothetical protein